MIENQYTPEEEDKISKAQEIISERCRIDKRHWKATECASVKVQRSSGAIEDGWEIIAEDGAGWSLVWSYLKGRHTQTKQIPTEELRALNPQLRQSKQSESNSSKVQPDSTVRNFARSILPSTERRAALPILPTRQEFLFMLQNAPKETLESQVLPLFESMEIFGNDLMNTLSKLHTKWQLPLTYNVYARGAENIPAEHADLIYTRVQFEYMREALTMCRDLYWHLSECETEEEFKKMYTDRTLRLAPLIKGYDEFLGH